MRMLKHDDHERLVQGLQGLKAQYGWEVNVVKLENMSREEQIALAARSTVLMGVHDIGLTSLIWMPTPRTTVMEFFFPETVSLEHEHVSRSLGVKHYGFWNDKHWTYPNVPTKDDSPHHAVPHHVHGIEVPIDADVVVKLCAERLIPTDASSPSS